MNSGRSHLWLWICEMFNCDLVVIACNNFHFGCIRCVADPSISVFKSSKWKENEWRFSIHKSKCRAILETTVSRQKWTNCIQKLNNNEAHNIDWSFFFFRWRCSPLWALACRTMSLHFVLSVTSPLHLLTAITWRSLSTPSLHPFLDLPFRLVSSSSWVNIFLGILSSSILSRWPSQLILCPFIHFTIFNPLFNYSSSRFDISSSCHRNFQFWRTNICIDVENAFYVFSFQSNPLFCFCLFSHDSQFDRFSGL